jgi:hypothetical protein
MTWTGRILKTRWLSHVNLLLKNTVKKGILDIQLSRLPSMSKSHGEQNANGSWLDNRTERVLVVKTIALFEPFGNESCLVSLYAAIRLVLDFEHPLAVNNIGAR